MLITSASRPVIDPFGVFGLQHKIVYQLFCVNAEKSYGISPASAGLDATVNVFPFNGLQHIESIFPSFGKIPIPSFHAYWTFGQELVQLGQNG